MSTQAARLTPYHRDSDGEIAGYLRPVAGGNLVESVTLLGHALAVPGTRQEAEAVLEQRGLASLAEPWWVRAPADLALEQVNLRRPDSDWTWHRFLFIEVNRETVRLRPQYAPPGGSSVTVSLPANDLLHATRPG